MSKFDEVTKLNKNRKLAWNTDLAWNIDINTDFNIYKPQFSNNVEAEKKGLLIFGHGGLAFSEVRKKTTPEDTNLHFFVNHGEIALSSILRAMSSKTKTVETMESGDRYYNYTIGTPNDYEINQYIENIQWQAYFHEQGKLTYYDLLVTKENKRVKLSQLVKVAKNQGYNKIYTHICRGRMFPQIIPLRLHKWLKKKHSESTFLQRIWKLQLKEVEND